MKDKITGNVRIGCFGGFWGDSMTLAVAQFLTSPEADSIDYLVSDYLAEVTMCILAKKKAKPTAKMGEGGFVEDFVNGVWKPFGKMIMAKGIKVVVNAGGMNPKALKDFIDATSADWPQEAKPTVAAVLGDDISGSLEALARDGAFSDFAVDGNDKTVDEPLPNFLAGTKKKMLSSNAYLGSSGIVRALQEGAHVVVTGRVVDSAMVLGPLVFEHGWDPARDFDKLARGTIAGHCIECGAQCCGGNFTDWELGLQGGLSSSKLFENVGFPLVDVQRDGIFEVFKPSRTGGIVSTLSVSEQLLYEIGDPAAYIVPDVACDVRQMRLTQVGKDRVRVDGVVGNPSSGKLKVTATFSDGWIGTISFVVVGRDARLKAAAISKSIVGRAEKQLTRMGAEAFSAVRIEYFGSNELYKTKFTEAREVVVRLTAHHKTNPKSFGLLAMHVPSASTGMSPGLFSLSASRSAPSEAVRLVSALVLAEKVPTKVIIGPSGSCKEITLATVVTPASAPVSRSIVAIEPPTGPSKEMEELVEAPLIVVACCRSGDKGNAANVAVASRKPKYFAAIKAQVTSEAVRAELAPWFDDASNPGTVTRFELPGIHALNFVCTNVLGGGGLMSLKGDKQAKTMGSILLDFTVKMPKKWVDEYETEVNAVKKSKRSKL